MIDEDQGGHDYRGRLQRQGFTKSAVKTILLVEDYKDTSELLTSFLEGPGYRVSKAADDMAALVDHVWRRSCGA